MNSGSRLVVAPRIARGLAASPRRWIASARVLTLTLGFLGVSTTLRFALTDNLYPDDAELTVAAQTLRGGYSDQPPLYTWLLWLVFHLTGPGLAGLTLVRVALLAALIGLTDLTARLVVADRRLVTPAAISALLLPSYAWHAATYLTHSLLLGVAVMGTVYAVARVVRTGRAFDYLWLGVAVGVGAMAKYNFALVVLAALAAGLTVPALRPRLLNRRLLLAAGVAALVLLPHAVWLADWSEEVFRLLRDKSNKAQSPPYWAGVKHGVWALAHSLFGCLALAVPVFAWLGRGAARVEPADPVIAWLGRFLLVLAIIHVGLVFGCGVTRFQDRWLQPMLLPLPLWFFGRLAPGALSHLKVRLLTWGTAALAAALLAGQLGQIAFVDRLPGRYPMRLDYPGLAHELDAAGFGRATIVGPDREILGNLRHYLPDATLIYPAGVEKFKRPTGPLVVLWDQRWGPSPPWVLMPEVARPLGSPNPTIGPVSRLAIPVRGSDASVTVFVAEVPTSPPVAPARAAAGRR